MGIVAINTEECDRSPGCPARLICPRGAIEPVQGGSYPGANGYSVRDDRCAGCGICVRACPARAISSV